MARFRTIHSKRQELQMHNNNKWNVKRAMPCQKTKLFVGIAESPRFCNYKTSKTEDKADGDEKKQHITTTIIIISI